MKKKQMIHILKNEDGSVLVVAVLILLSLTIIGISAMSTSTIDIQISANDKFHKMAFYAADAGVSYVAGDTDLYGPDNTVAGGQLTFPDINNANATYALSNRMQINGSVPYVGKTHLPRGSGYSSAAFKAINYQIISNGTGANNGAGTIHAGFYRIGF